MFADTESLLNNFQIRKNSKQKASFRGWLAEKMQVLNYQVSFQSGGSIVKSTNVIVGDPKTAQVVYTAHYDTCAVLPFPNFITPRNLLLYLLYQFLVVILFFVLAIGSELILLRLWPDAPMWLAIAVVYFVLGVCLWWTMAGAANKHTMNDNTSGVATLMEIAASLPEDLKHSTAFIFFDNEEKGLLGSSLFKKKFGPSMKDKLVINFDCVSDGDYIQFYPNKAIKSDSKTIALIENSFVGLNDKTVEIVTGFGFYPSDQKAFVKGIGVAAMHRGKLGYYLGRIHTHRDTVFQRENIELLRTGAVKLASLIEEKE